MDEINNEEKKETLQPVVESLEPVVESLDDEPIETIDSGGSASAPSEVSTEAQPGFIEINSEASTTVQEVAAPEVIKSVETPEAVTEAPAPAVFEATAEPVTEAQTESPQEVKEEPPKALETKPKEKKRVSPVLVIVVILLIALAGAAGYFIATTLGGKESSGSTNPSGVSTASVDKVVFSGLTFDIPKSYSATIADNMLSIEDSNGVNYAITVDDRSYANISANKDMFKNNFESNGYTTKDYVEKDVAGSRYLYIDLNNGTNIRTFFRSIDPTSTFIGVIVRGDNSEVTDEDLNTIEKILVTAREDASSREINGPEGSFTSYDDIFSILKDRGSLADETQNPDTVEPEPAPSEEPTPVPSEEPTPEPVPESPAPVEEQTPTEPEAPSTSE